MDDMNEELYNLIFVCQVLQSSIRYCRHEREALQKIEKILYFLNDLINTFKEPET